jgi:hypothetical protein
MLQQAGGDQFSYFVGVKAENRIIDAGCVCAVSFHSEAQKAGSRTGIPLKPTYMNIRAAIKRQERKLERALGS